MTIPELPDGSILYWPASDAEDLIQAMVRDDALAELVDGPEERWFVLSNTDDAGVRWTDVVEDDSDLELNVADAVRLVRADDPSVLVVPEAPGSPLPVMVEHVGGMVWVGGLLGVTPDQALALAGVLVRAARAGGEQ